MYNEKLWCVRVTIFVVEMQKCFPFEVTCNNVIVIASLAMETERYILCVVALCMSLPTMRNTIRSLFKMPDFCAPF